MKPGFKTCALWKNGCNVQQGYSRTEDVHMNWKLDTVIRNTG